MSEVNEIGVTLVKDRRTTLTSGSIESLWTEQQNELDKISKSPKCILSTFAQIHLRLDTLQIDTNYRIEWLLFTITTNRVKDKNDNIRH